MRPLILTLILTAAIPAWGASPETAVQDGDLIFHTSRGPQSLAIRQATGSPYSHMGIIFFREGRPYVFEALGTVRYTPLSQWIERGSGHHFVVKRLHDANEVLTTEAVEKLKSFARQFEGKTYDFMFEWSDERMYCSELVWKLYDRALGIQIGQLQKLSEFNLSDPEVKKKMKERYGDRVPLQETVISPVQMFRSERLVSVLEQ